MPRKSLEENMAEFEFAKNRITNRAISGMAASDSIYDKLEKLRVETGMVEDIEILIVVATYGKGRYESDKKGK